MTREEFARWKYDGKEVWEVLRNRIRQVEYEVARAAGIDQMNDRFKAGYLAGLEATLDIEWEDSDASES